MARISRIGWVPLKGMSWVSSPSAEVTASGLAGDRCWAPVTPELRCLKATDHPTMVRLPLAPERLPTAADALFDGREVDVTYYRHQIPARIHRGALAEELSAEAGRELWLAQTSARRFIYGSPVSVLLHSELEGLPTDTDRYRPNIVIDDSDQALELRPGSRLQLGEVELDVAEELERCIIINHHAGTGEADHSLLKKIRPGALLAYGCKVRTPGPVHVGDTARLL